MDKRKIEESIFKILMRVATLSIVISLAVILISIIYKAIPVMNWGMISQTPQGGFYLGENGGVLNAILGSLYLATGATILALMLSFPIVFYINIYAKKGSWFVHTVRLCFDILWGIPSIVYGAFGFSIMILLGMRTSLFAGIIVIALVILPIIVRALDEVVRMIPQGLLDASYSLGATKTQTSVKIVTRQALPGLITAILIAFGRGIGDAAAVLFTTGYTDNVPTSLFDSAATLPLAIFFQLGSPVEAVQNRAFASALILTIIILSISILARYFSGKYNKFKV
ncbi:MAG: ABC transporter permease subunit [Bacteroidota bacterium]|nr:ABC transporter permease subunit [Bacteroidota bacterium]